MVGGCVMTLRYLSRVQRRTRLGARHVERKRVREKGFRSWSWSGQVRRLFMRVSSLDHPVDVIAVQAEHFLELVSGPVFEIPIAFHGYRIQMSTNILECRVVVAK